MDDEREMGLRERKARQTRWALSDATLELAFERGLENVRREDIAARAGVSVRTFNNYFAGKHEAISYRQIERLQRSVAMLRAAPPDAPLWEAIADAMAGPLEDDGATTPPNPDQLREVRKFLDAPETHAVMQRRVFDFEGELAAAIGERTGTDPTRDLYPKLVVGAIAGVFMAAFDTYINASPPVVLPTMLRRAFAEVAAGLPVPPKEGTPS